MCKWKSKLKKTKWFKLEGTQKGHELTLSSLSLSTATVPAFMSHAHIWTWPSDLSRSCDVAIYSSSIEVIRGHSGECTADGIKEAYMYNKDPRTGPWASHIRQRFNCSCKWHCQYINTMACITDCRTVPVTPNLQGRGNQSVNYRISCICNRLYIPYLPVRITCSPRPGLSQSWSNVLLGI